MLTVMLQDIKTLLRKTLEFLFVFLIITFPFWIIFFVELYYSSR